MTAWEPDRPEVVTWILDAVGRDARIVSIELMPPSATEKHRIHVEAGSGPVTLVLRRYHDTERLGIDPWYVAAHEARALQLLEASPVPAPRLLAADVDGEVCDVPALLESWVPGEPAWQPDDVDGYLCGAAEVLVAIHAIDPPDDGSLPAYRPYFADEDRPITSGVPTWSARRAMWERVVVAVDRGWPAVRMRFIHRDYHPGNALWDGREVSGVVDWATAALGPPGIDLGRMRQNLAGWHGREVADRFTRRYLEAGGDPSARDPFWDLLDAVDSVVFMDEPAAPGDGDVERFEDYVAGVASEI